MRYVVLLLSLFSFAQGQKGHEATLAEQKACSDQAQSLKADGGVCPHGTSCTVTSHYSKPKNICWVSVRALHLDDDGTLKSEIQGLLDGFENANYGTCAINVAPKREVVTCWVREPGTRESKEFSDGSEWRKFVQAYYLSD